MDFNARDAATIVVRRLLALLLLLTRAGWLSQPMRGGIRSVFSHLVTRTAKRQDGASWIIPPDDPALLDAQYLLGSVLAGEAGEIPEDVELSIALSLSRLQRAWAGLPKRWARNNPFLINPAATPNPEYTGEVPASPEPREEEDVQSSADASDAPVPRPSPPSSAASVANADDRLDRLIQMAGTSLALIRASTPPPRRPPASTGRERRGPRDRG